MVASLSISPFFVLFPDFAAIKNPLAFSNQLPVDGHAI